MVFGAPFWTPLECTLGLWNDYGIRWQNVGLARVHLVMTVAFVLLLVWAQAKRQQRMAGRCPTRGYDLRASPARCPECGTVGGGTRTA